jgi:large conductance mechanosensitive channel
MFKEFKTFIMRGNVMDMAIGIVIGTAFGLIVSSLVKDIIMPPIGLALGRVDFSNLFVLLRDGTTPGPYASLADAQNVGAVTINYGIFINTIISFLIIGFAMFLIVRMINAAYKKEVEPAPAPVTTKECPHCYSVIPIKATRCPYCTSQL